MAEPKATISKRVDIKMDTDTPNSLTMPATVIDKKGNRIVGQANFQVDAVKRTLIFNYIVWEDKDEQ